MEYGLVSSDKDKNIYRAHADDMEGVPFKTGNNASEIVQKFLDLPDGEGILIPANMVNSFLRAMEAVQETRFILVPSIKGMRRFSYCGCVNNDGYNYIAIKLWQDATWKITEVNMEPRKILD